MGRLSAVFRSRYFYAAVAGVLLAAAFPRISWSGLAWVAPAIAVAAALGVPAGWERFRIGYVAGLAFYLTSLSWLLNIPFRWMGIPFGPAAGWLALSGYLALYQALWVWLVTTALTPHAHPRTWMEAARSLFARGWLARTALALYAAVSWVALEMILARLFSGFPWDLLGVSQYQLTPLIQIASVTGVYGVSFLVIWVSLSLLMAVIGMIARPAAPSLWGLELLLPAAGVACLFVFGLHQISAPQESGRFLKVALVQPSIPQTLIWDASKNEERFQDVLRLSENAMTNKPDLLVWPESAVPTLFRQDEVVRNAITGLARRNDAFMVIGADDYALKPNARSDRDVDYYNASFLISPEGAVLDTYRKRSLVIFGEYVPLERWLPFVKYLTPISGGFTPGDKSVQFNLPGLSAALSVLICFEDIFPSLAREGAQPDTDFLLNLTNNGWFGESAAQMQHAATAVFRAVENRIPLVRCSNNGFTGWVDKYGRIRQQFLDAKGSIYGPGFLLCQIPLLAPGELREPTPYHRHGDRFGWTCVLLTIVWLPSRLARKERS